MNNAEPVYKYNDEISVVQVNSTLALFLNGTLVRPLGTLEEALAIRCQVLTQERDAALEREAAMAAHVERLTELFKQGFDSGDDHDLVAWEEEAKKALAETPTTSLTRRDLIKQAEGLRLAADFIEQKATDYDAEHGSTDPSTGHREYPGDGADYYNEMIELADDLRQQAKELATQ